jgi:glycine reductase
MMRYGWYEDMEFADMRLDIAQYVVQDVRFADRLAWEHGTLTIAREQLRSLFCQEPHIHDVALDIVRPGESARIINVLDTVAPMVKVEGPSTVFPGFLGPPQTCGRGRTHKLLGLNIVQSAILPDPQHGVLSVREGIIDMSGPAAPYCAAAETIDLVAVFTPAPYATNVEFDAAIRRGTLRVAQTLAAATRSVRPEDVRSYDLADSGADLPPVVYIVQVRQQGPLVQSFLYGHHLENFVPTILHPNELLDGALVSGNYTNSLKIPTYARCNDPVLASLLQRHGQDIRLIGVILSRGHCPGAFEKERNAHYAAKLAQLLGSEGAVLTTEGLGNGMIEFMQTIEACERLGIRTVAIVLESGGDEPPVLGHVPEADALVSTGGMAEPLALPAVECVLGGETIEFFTGATVDAHGSFTVTPMELYASAWKMGLSGITAVDY